MKNCSFILVTFLTLFFSFAPQVFAKVWINEFSSNGSGDWIELYNDGTESVDLQTLRIRDGSSTNKLDLSGTIDAGGFAVFDWSTKLNNGGDTIKLVLASDESSVIDQIVYGDEGEIAAPASNQSAGRQPNGDSVWALFSNPSKNASNAQSQSAPTPTDVPERTPTPTKVPTPTKTPTPKKLPTSTKSPTQNPQNVSDDESDEEANIPVKTTATKNQLSPKLSGVPTSILGFATKSATPKPKAKVSGDPTPKVMVQGTTSPPYFIMAAGTIFCVACGILVFLKRRSNHES